MTKCPFAVAAFALICFPNLSHAQVVLTFDDLATGPISTQYQSRGATFNSPLVRDYSATPGFTHSGTQAIELCYAAEFCTATLNVDFTTGQKYVKVFVGFTSQLSQASPVLLRALDAHGALVGQQTAVLGPSSGAIPIQIPLEVTSQAGRIRQIIVGFAASDAFNNGLAFDDLGFSAAGSPPPCTATTNPTVTLSQPDLNPTVQINEFILQGTVTTAAPLDQATLTVTGAGGTKSTNVLGTIVQPTSGPFGAIRIDESLFPGTNTVTLAAHNCHGTGQASATVTYAPVGNGTVIKLLRMEITQATQDMNNSVPLIAGKPTAVRLYFSTMGATNAINAVRGDIMGFREGGNTPFLAQSVGTTDVDASQDVYPKRLDLTKSLNFLLSPDFFQQGLLHFWVQRLNVEGPGGATLACDGCVEWKASFGRAKPLNLVVVPFVYLAGNRTADTGNTLMGGLGYLNNVYPLAGNFPTDTSGINLLTILPIRSTSLVLPRDNNDMLCDLQNILDDLLAQPSPPPADTHILGVGPSGQGVAYNPGTAAYGDIRAIEDASQKTDPEYYGSVWAQEIGHNFGRKHVSTSHGEEPPTDPAFPYLHGGIGEPGLAIGTEWWNGTPFVLDPGLPADGSKHAHDFMSYGMTQDPADHTNSWVSPFTYVALAHLFQTQALPQAPRDEAAADKLVISGNIDKTGVATLRPFHIVKTAFARGSGASGDLSVSLLDAAGKTLLTYRFSGQAISNSTSVAFNEFVPWKAETKQIVLKRDQTVLARRAVSANKPTVKVTRPKAGETWGEKATVAWEADDADKDPLSYTVFYNSGADQRWVPIATDVTGLSVSVDTALLVGSKKARVRVRATDGVNTTEADSAGTFTVPEHPPLVAILGMANGTVLCREGAEFSGAAYDPRDGVLSATHLKWSSDRDGTLGNGPHIKATKPLSIGAHVITLTATNNQGRTASKRVKIVAK